MLKQILLISAMCLSFTGVPAVVMAAEGPIIADDNGDGSPNAATYSEDTNGDGYLETVTTYFNGINIYYPKTGKNNLYSYSATDFFAINSLKDTDGVAGVEIIVQWSKGTINGIDVIHDRTGKTNTYVYTGSFAVRGGLVCLDS
jgi:hypothetical protein